MEVIILSLATVAVAATVFCVSALAVDTAVRIVGRWRERREVRRFWADAAEYYEKRLKEMGP